MDRILIILKTNGPRASSAPAICSRSQVSVYRTIGPLVIQAITKTENYALFSLAKKRLLCFFSLYSLCDTLFQSAKESKEGKLKFFTGNVNKLLLE